MKHNIWKKILSIALALVLVATYLPIVPGEAATGSAYNQVGNKISDAPSVNEWKKFFANDSTAYAGGVWTDKSVFNSAAEYIAATDEDDDGISLSVNPNNFLVALSAIASNKEIKGYSTIPTDTVLVLDLSSSMQSAGAGSGIGTNNSAVDDLAVAANDAISRLLELNNNNRIAVVAYAGNDNKTFSSADGNVQVILPLDRYTATGGRFLQGARDANGNTDYRLQICSGVRNSGGGTVSGYMDSARSTYTQDGVYEAMNLLLGADTQITEGVQAGMERMPIMVLMTDGEPTLANPNYAGTSATELGNSTMYDYEGTLNGNQGGIYSSLSHRKTIAFVTSLTMAYAKKMLDSHYAATTPLLYTLAYGTAVVTREEALDMLNPAGARTNHTTMWNDFLAGNRVPVYRSGNQTTYIANADASEGNKHLTAEDRIYVDKYFSAQSGGLGSAFQDIVDEIVIQSKYYPTFVTGSAIDNDGYLEFDDYIGKNMEVKSDKGIQLGEKLYTGATFAEMVYTGGMGTVQNPTDVGNNLVWSLQKRLGIASVEDVRTLIGNAYANGQLSYNPDTGAYSNYIGWYADQNENFISFWDGKESSFASAPSGAYYAIKSYMYYDAVGEGHRKTDMMYATIRVSTCIKDDPNRAVEVGDVRVLGRLPASLIPLIEYEVELNGTDVLDPNALTVTGATAPSRLLYEVGLHSDIDLLDIANTAPEKNALEKDTNGNYVFYTNQWNARHQVTGTDFSYANNHNTISFFEPSLENERYYYTYDTPIYADENGTLYTGANAPTGTVYHRTVSYHKNGNAVTANYDYEPISQHVLTGTGAHSHLTKLADNTWVVNRGTLHHYFADYQKNKQNNETGTLDVAFMPFVHDNLDDSALHRFHVDFYLGNNGKLTIDPPEGIKISKITDDTITDKSTDYTFTVRTNYAFNEELQFVKEDVSGVRTESTITFTDGSASFTLKHGETAWILGDAMENHAFAVTESTGTGYVLKSVDGDTTRSSADLAVTADTILSTVFENTAMPVGSVVIGKDVVSDFADHQNKEFEFTVSISGNRLVAGRAYTITRSDGQSFTVVPGLRGTDITLKHNQYVSLSGLPAGTTVTATESPGYSREGFTVNQQTQTATVEADTTKYLNFQNTYKADPVRADAAVFLRIVKRFRSDTNWDATFNFKLQRYIWASESYEDVLGSIAHVTYTNEKDIKVTVIDFANETFTAPGTYYYRIVEIVDSDLEEQGILFDSTPVYFRVEVADDGQGQLYISDVASTDALVDGNAQSGWMVESSFTNSYNVNGAAEVVLNMKKTVTSDYGVTIPPAGFKFELYASNAAWDLTLDPIRTSSITGAGGLADIQLVYDDPATDLGTHYYVLKEHHPADADKREGVTYTNAKYGIKVDVGHSSGHFTVSATTYDLSGTTPAVIKTYTGTGGTATNSIITATTENLEFRNYYEPKAESVSVDVHKTLLGADPNRTFRFRTRQVYYKADGTVDSYGPEFSPDLSVNGTVSFTVTGIISLGTTYFEISEVIPSGAVNNVYQGVTYDPSVFIVKIEKTADNINGVLIPSVTITKDGQPVTAIVFENSYKAAPVEVTLEANKHLDGDIRKLQVGAYEFELVNRNGSSSDVIQTVANGIPTGDYDAPVTFDKLTFTEPGTYRYSIREAIPQAAKDNNNELHGVKYDTTEYPVVVTVTDPGDGQLVANVDYGNNSSQVPQFVNTYTVSPTSVDLSAKKILSGDSLANRGAFSFILREADWDTATQSVVETRVLAGRENDANGNVLFSHNDIPELNFEHIGAYRFTIREASPPDPGDMIYDTNYYLIEVDVTDDLQGGLKTETIVTRYDLLGNATSVEMNGPTTGIVFQNILPPKPITIDLSGMKYYTKDLKDGDFTFDMYEAEKDAAGNLNAIGDPILSATNKADGSFVFKDITYTDPDTTLEVSTNYLTYHLPGTHYFVIKERMPDGVDHNHVLNGIKYDPTLYAIEITVSLENQNGRDTLVADMTVDGLIDNPLRFENEYNASGDKGIVISGTKVMTGKELVSGEFNFGLYSAHIDQNGILIHDDLIESVENEGDTFTFKEITYPSFSNVGLYHYVVKEMIPVDIDENLTLDGITYDDTVYMIMVNVEDNGDGTMKVTGPSIQIVNEDGSFSELLDEITFKNIFTPEPEEPEETHPGEPVPGEPEPEETEPEETEPEETEPEETEPEETEPEETEPEETEPEETEPEETEPEETEPEETEPEETEPEETEPEETEPKEPEVPDTGDDGRLALWVALLTVSSLALAAMLIAGKKKA